MDTMDERLSSDGAQDTQRTGQIADFLARPEAAERRVAALEEGLRLLMGCHEWQAKRTGGHACDRYEKARALLAESEGKR